MTAAEILAGTHLVEALGYWVALRGDEAVPAKARVTPSEMPRGVLPWVSLAERHGDGRWFGRLAGTEAVRLTGLETRGRAYDEMLEPAAYERWRGPAEQALAGKMPVAAIGSIAVPGRQFITVRYLMMPLRGGVEVDNLLCCLYWERGRRVDPAIIRQLAEDDLVVLAQQP